LSILIGSDHLDDGDKREQKIVIFLNYKKMTIDSRRIYLDDNKK